jgi:hypothetical protein
MIFNEKLSLFVVKTIDKRPLGVKHNFRLNQRAWVLKYQFQSTGRGVWNSG